MIVSATTPAYSYKAVNGTITFSGGHCQILDVTGDILAGSLQFSGHYKKSPTPCFETVTGSVTINSFNK